MAITQLGCGSGNYEAGLNTSRLMCNCLGVHVPRKREMHPAKIERSDLNEIY